VKKAAHYLNPKRGTRRKSVAHSITEIKEARPFTEMVLEELEDDGIRVERPKFRNQCPSARPCPFVGCKYNLYLDITETGNIKYNFYGIDPWELNVSCALDVADENSNGEMSLNDIGRFMGLTRERVRQIEKDAVKKLKQYAKDHTEWKDE